MAKPRGIPGDWHTPLSTHPSDPLNLRPFIRPNSSQIETGASGPPSYEPALPAMSRMGMKIDSTTVPTTSPMTEIRMGSIREVRALTWALT